MTFPFDLNGEDWTQEKSSFIIAELTDLIFDDISTYLGGKTMGKNCLAVRV